MDSLQYHKSQLQVHCRVCTGKLGRVSYACEKHAKMLLECIDLNVSNDSPNVHPTKFCNNCYAVIKKISKALLDGTTARSSLQPFSFEQHNEGSCRVCTHFREKAKGGRPRKHKNIASCPRSVVDHIRAVAGPSLRCILPLTIERFFTPAPGSFSLSDLKCPVCQNVVDEPVELACKSPICYTCCLGMLRKSDGGVTECPSCHEEHELAINSFQAISPVVTKLLSNLVIRCEVPSCNKPVLLQHLGKHIESGCKEMVADVASTLTVEQVLEQPLDVPPTSLEKRAAGHLVRKMLHQSCESNTFTVPPGSRGGHVSSVISIGFSNLQLNKILVEHEVYNNNNNIMSR